MLIHAELRHPNAQLPAYQTSGAAGLDLVACEPVTIPSHEWRLVPTGLVLHIPERYEAQVRSRSGLALKHGVVVLNSPGTIDSDYRGTIGVILMNHGRPPLRIGVGARIAQLVIAEVARVTLTPDSVEFGVHVPASGCMLCDDPYLREDDSAPICSGCGADWSAPTRGAGGFGSTG